MNDIETFAEVTVQRVNEIVKKHSRNWLIAFGLAVILLIVLLVVVFKKNHDNPPVEQGNIELLKRNNALLDSLLKTKDTVLIENRKTETRIIKEYEKIPVDIKSLDREQLRREVTNY